MIINIIDIQNQTHILDTNNIGNNAFNIDCMDVLKKLPDNCFDLAVVDPPYGIEKAFSATSRIQKYGQMKTVNDKKPTIDYFKQLFRVSRNQIVWGYNHLSDMLPTTKEFLFWYKHNPVVSYSDGELAWTSFKKTAKCFDYPFFGCTGADKDGRIHPTQKPIELYAWIFSRYAKPGYKILDTHLGSGSSRIAAYDAGLEFLGMEIDEYYFQEQEKRFYNYTSQMNFFVDKELSL
jgi:site-specific DNA-methyltransferase (adenine-specific)|nr:MAG TPA: adenine specific DNA methyltransferase [Caudoviricetes sp.]